MHSSAEGKRPGTPPAPEKIAACLEAKGWKRSVAGSEDFDAAVEAIRLAEELRLGLLVAGEYGRGKTMLAEILARAFGAAFKVRLGYRGEWERLTPGWLDYTAEDPFAQSVFIDDIGSEPRINNFGEKVEHVADFLCEWHARHEPGTRLVATTNMNAKELDCRYGGRVLSRLKDLCVFLRLDGEDHRVAHVVSARRGRR